MKGHTCTVLIVKLNAKLLEICLPHLTCRPKIMRNSMIVWSGKKKIIAIWDRFREVLGPLLWANLFMPCRAFLVFDWVFASSLSLSQPVQTRPDDKKGVGSDKNENVRQTSTSISTSDKGTFAEIHSVGSVFLPFFLSLWFNVSRMLGHTTSLDRWTPAAYIFLFSMCAVSFLANRYCRPFKWNMICR